MTSVPAELRKIRKETGLSMRDVAEVVFGPGKAASSYQHYESETKFTKHFLPMEIAEKLAVLFAGHGVAQERVFRLCGVDASNNVPLNADLVADKIRRTVRTLNRLLEEGASIGVEVSLVVTKGEKSCRIEGVVTSPLV